MLDKPAQGVRYVLHEMAITAALAGQDVALVFQVYVEKELECGLLVAPWPQARSLSKRFCLVKPLESGINESALQAFEQWLVMAIKGPTASRASTFYESTISVEECARRSRYYWLLPPLHRFSR